MEEGVFVCKTTFTSARDPSKSVEIFSDLDILDKLKQVYQEVIHIIFTDKIFLTIDTIDQITHNVWRFEMKRPKDLSFEPGQATELAIDKEGWRENGRIFTFTSLPGEDHLEFIIKSYPEREAMTKEIAKLKVGDRFIMKNIYGSIQYKGKGTFIAGGAGVTPFISIIRDLADKDELNGHRLIFANNKAEDIIHREEFERLLGADFFNLLAEENAAACDQGLITKEYLENHIESFDDYFYVCGPPGMMQATLDALNDLGVQDEQIIKETF